MLSTHSKAPTPFSLISIANFGWWKTLDKIIELNLLDKFEIDIYTMERTLQAVLKAKQFELFDKLLPFADKIFKDYLKEFKPTTFQGFWEEEPFRMFFKSAISYCDTARFEKICKEYYRCIPVPRNEVDANGYYYNTKYDLFSEILFAAIDHGRSDNLHLVLQTGLEEHFKQRLATLAHVKKINEKRFDTSHAEWIQRFKDYINEEDVDSHTLAFMQNLLRESSKGGYRSWVKPALDICLQGCPEVIKKLLSTDQTFNQRLTQFKKFLQENPHIIVDKELYLQHNEPEEKEEEKVNCDQLASHLVKPLTCIANYDTSFFKRAYRQVYKNELAECKRIKVCNKSDFIQYMQHETGLCKSLINIIQGYCNMNMDNVFNMMSAIKVLDNPGTKRIANSLVDAALMPVFKILVTPEYVQRLEGFIGLVDKNNQRRLKRTIFSDILSTELTKAGIPLLQAELNNEPGASEDDSIANVNDNSDTVVFDLGYTRARSNGVQ